MRPNLNPYDLGNLLDAVDKAYRDFVNDIVQGKKTLEQNSKELFKVNEELKTRVQVKLRRPKSSASRIESIVNSVQQIVLQTGLEGW